ncbi:MAG TPA: alpha/beta hydrolase [Solirubrobacteraceae bacterium]|nr:alpha/beta hydrolase [Solirubrobacteraceae bacterium]
MPIPGGALAYWDTGGTGPPVILLHAATHCARMWGRQREAFVARGYRVIGYSRRGHRGSTSLRADDAGVGAADLEAFVTGLQLDRFHLVAVAAGGFFATDYALSRPERLISLTVGSSMMGVADPAFRERVEQLHPPGFRDLPAAFRELGPSYRATDPDGVRAWLHLHRDALEGRPFVLQGLAKDITLDRLAELAVPTLIVGAGADLIIPAPLTREIAERIPGAVYDLLADSGHMPSWEAPDAFNAVVLRFLDATG